MTFIDQLKKLDAEASPGEWNPGGTDDWITIFKDYSAIARIEHKVKKTPVNEEDWANSEIICILRNNTQAIIELVEAVESYIEFGHAEDCEINDTQCTCRLDFLEFSLSKLKGDV